MSTSDTDTSKISNDNGECNLDTQCDALDDHPIFLMILHVEQVLLIHAKTKIRMI
jgi:hypothetical protein